jgi:hypothetical protein
LNEISEQDDAPKPAYRRFERESEFQDAVEHLLSLPGRELRIFDRDLSGLKTNAPARTALIEKFLKASRVRRIYVVVHETEHITRSCPRLMALLARYSHMLQINRTHEMIRNLQDAFLVLDAKHYVRRPSATFYRGAIGVNDDGQALEMRARFQEIWAASFPGVSSTTVGL